MWLRAKALRHVSEPKALPQTESFPYVEAEYEVIDEEEKKGKKK